MKSGNSKAKLAFGMVFAACSIWASMHFQALNQGQTAAANSPTLGHSNTTPSKPEVKVSLHPAWNELSTAQREALIPLSGVWDQLDEERRHKWLHIARRFFSMTPHQQERAQKRMQDWVNLTPEQRDLARSNFTNAKHVDKSHKQALWEAYSRLPEDRKQKLAVAGPMKNRAVNSPADRPGNNAPTPFVSVSASQDHVGTQAQP
jgi:hypothetical protein